MLFGKSSNFTLLFAFKFFGDLSLIFFDLYFNIIFVLIIFKSMTTGESILQSSVKFLLLTLLFIFKHILYVVKTCFMGL